MQPSAVRSTLNPTSPPIAISASATARPPSLTSCTPVTSRSATSSATNSCSARATVEIGDRRHAARLAVHDRGPLRTAELGPRSSPSTTIESPGAGAAGGGASRELVDQAEHADDRRRVDVGAAGLVVEAARCRRSTGMPSASHASLIPSTTSANCHITSGCSGLPKFRQFTSAQRLGAGATRRCARLRARPAGHRCAGRAGRTAPCRRSRARAPSSCPSRAAPPRRAPGPTTVFRNSWWSYWRDTHVLSAIVGVASSASSSAERSAPAAELRRAASARGSSACSSSCAAGRASGRLVRRAVAEAADRHVGDRLRDRS